MSKMLVTHVLLAITAGSQSLYTVPAHWIRNDTNPALSLSLSLSLCLCVCVSVFLSVSQRMAEKLVVGLLAETVMHLMVPI